ncbi:hypothetical protein CSH63_33095 [Micromonospora tulbaghiae]|uniref:Uncharacterized protein n=1 Tax=Micromonospora tulbaghiae TaxID=479978 RepID=A0A386WW16_9ACTN|nr:hypothetical protein [Micromonospora tulbaghiae]AYF32193.1 hypothetical protein CSH63_33095 [Micromonospora tulbaghiae]
MRFDELRGDLTYAAPIPPTAAGTAVEVPIVRLPFAALITEIVWVPGAAMVANGANYVTLNARNRQAGTGTVVMATRAYNAGNGVASTPEALNLSGNATDLQPAAGDVLTAHFTHTGTGLAVPAGLVQVKLRIR